MAGETSPQTALLNALADGGCRTMDALADLLPLGRRQISNAAARLVARGWVERIEAGCFRLTEAGKAAQAAGTPIKPGPRGPMEKRRQPRQSLNTRLWRAMRLVGKFTLHALVELAAREEKDPKGAALRFVTALERAGYLTRLARREPGTAPQSNGFVRWLLVKDTGDLPPMPRRKRRAVYDPNTGETVSWTG